jgi:hypothetical protein
MSDNMTANTGDFDGSNLGDGILVQFSGIDQKMFIRDEYWTDPTCDCTIATLRFFEVSKEGETVSEWFLIKLDMKTWEIKENKFFNIMIDADKMIKEFVEGLDGIKETLTIHSMRVKGLDTSNAVDFMTHKTEKMILEGLVLGYEEIFGKAEMISFSMDSEEKNTWTIDDQYCSSPKCLCNEAVLTFFKIDKEKYQQAPAFSIRMNIKNYSYDVEYNEVGIKKINEVMDHLKAHEPEILKTIYKRYYDVKTVTKDVLKKHRIGENQSQSKIKVGRNDPCTCGSGKKYKKCCGK